MTTCKDCGRERPLQDFPVRNRRRGKTRRMPYCRDCVQRNAREIYLNGGPRNA